MSRLELKDFIKIVILIIIGGVILILNYIGVKYIVNTYFLRDDNSSVSAPIDMYPSYFKDKDKKNREKNEADEMFSVLGLDGFEKFAFIPEETFEIGDIKYYNCVNLYMYEYDGHVYYLNKENGETVVIEDSSGIVPRN